MMLSSIVAGASCNRIDEGFGPQTYDNAVYLQSDGVGTIMRFVQSIILEELERTSVIGLQRSPCTCWHCAK